MATDTELAIAIRAEAEGALRELRRLRDGVEETGQSGERAGRGMRRLGTETESLQRGLSGVQRAARAAAAGLAAIGVGISFGAVIRNTIRQEQAIARVDVRIRGLGDTTSLTTRELEQMASALQRATTFGDEEILEAQALLLTFRRIAEENFEATTEAVLDVAAAMGTDLRGAALQIGRAMEDPARGMDALRRAGVVFTDDQRDMIAALVEAGDAAGAQRLILAELEAQVGGTARAMRETFGGALQGARNAFGDLLEARGGLNEAREALEDLTSLLQDPATIEAAQALTGALIRGFGAVVEFVVAVDFLFAGARDEMIALDDQIARSQRNIERLRAELERPRGRRTVGPGQPVEDEIERRERLLAAIEREQARLADLTEEYWSLADAQGAANDAADERPDPDDTEASAGAVREHAAAIEQLIARLQEQADTHGLTATEVALYRLEMMGATEAELERARAIADRIDQLEAAAEADAAAARAAEEAAAAEQRRLDQLERAGERVFRDTRTEAEALNAEIERLNELLDAGAINLDTYDRALADVNARMDALGDEAGATGEELSEFARSAASNIQRELADALFEPWDANLADMATSWARTLARMVVEAQAAALLDHLFSGGQGGGSSSEQGFAQFLGLLATGFATGGRVRGAGGPTDDRNVIAVSDGEYIVRSAAVDRYGQGLLDSINAMRLPRYAAGGPVGAIAASTPGAPAAPAAADLRIINAIDDDDIADAMAGAPGERVVLNHIRRNRAALRRALEG